MAETMTVRGVEFVRCSRIIYASSSLFWRYTHSRGVSIDLYEPGSHMSSSLGQEDHWVACCSGNSHHAESVEECLQGFTERLREELLPYNGTPLYEYLRPFEALLADLIKAKRGMN